MRLASWLAAVTLLAASAPAAAYDDRTTQRGRDLPAPPAAASVRPAISTPPTAADAPVSDSVDPEGLRRAIAAFRAKLPAPIKIVQLTIFPNDIVALSTDAPGGAVEYVYRDGAIGAPEVMNTEYLDCKTGMPASALDLDVLPDLVADARERAGIRDGAVLQIVVGQYPCGTAFLSIPVEKPGTRPVSVQYDGRGRFVKLFE